MGTPLLTASTPVIAVQPFAKACASSHGEAATTGGGAAGTSLGAPERKRPTRITNPSAATKAYVGIMNTAPVVRTPRRFTTVMSKSTPRQIGSVLGCSEGTAETSAPTPAEIATATLRR